MLSWVGLTIDAQRIDDEIRLCGLWTKDKTGKSPNMQRIDKIRICGLCSLTVSVVVVLLLHVLGQKTRTNNKNDAIRGLDWVGWDGNGKSLKAPPP